MANDVFCESCAARAKWEFDHTKVIQHSCQRCFIFRPCNDYSYKTNRHTEPAPAPKQLVRDAQNSVSEAKLPPAKVVPQEPIPVRVVNPPVQPQALVESLHEGQTKDIPPMAEIPATGIPEGGIKPPAPPEPEMVPKPHRLIADPVERSALAGGTQPGSMPPAPQVTGREVSDRPVAPAGAGRPAEGQTEADAALDVIHPKRKEEGVRVTVETRPRSGGKK